MITRSLYNKIKKEGKNRLIFYDLETTGLNPYHCKIIEIAAVDNLGNKFHCLLKINNKLDKKITELTKITDKELLLKGIEQEVGLENFFKFIHKYGDIFENNTYLIAHNNNAFDKLFIKSQFKKYNLVLSKNIKFFDTLRFSQFILPKMRFYSMKTLCNYFNVINKNAHRAMSDVKSLMKIYSFLTLIFKQKYGTKSIEIIYNKINL